jgi:TetR/AcrR family transcriptional repressor of nem operon
MARTKAFDPDAALARARDLFWQRGYEATSMADLVEHLGIGRASIYATFGSKHDLYVAALDRYAATLDPDPVDVLSQPGPALPAVRRLVRGFGNASLTDPQHKGCMVVNAAVELMPTDPVVARVVQASWDRLETALISALTRAKAQGELGPDKDPYTLGRFLFVVLQGLRVLGRGDAERARVDDAVAQALAALD